MHPPTGAGDVDVAEADGTAVEGAVVDGGDVAVWAAEAKGSRVALGLVGGVASASRSDADGVADGAEAVESDRAGGAAWLLAEASTEQPVPANAASASARTGSTPNVREKGRSSDCTLQVSAVRRRP